MFFRFITLIENGKGFNSARKKRPIFSGGSC